MRNSFFDFQPLTEESLFGTTYPIITTKVQYKAQPKTSKKLPLHLRPPSTKFRNTKKSLRVIPKSVLGSRNRSFRTGESPLRLRNLDLLLQSMNSPRKSFNSSRLRRLVKKRIVIQMGCCITPKESTISAIEAGSVQSLKQAGNKAFKQGNFELAIQAYNQALAISQDTFLYSNRAQCYLKLERLKEAMADSKAAIQLSPDNVKACIIAARTSARLFLKEKVLERLDDSEDYCKTAMLKYQLLSQEGNLNFAKELSIKIRVLKIIQKVNSKLVEIEAIKNYYQGRIPQNLASRLQECMEDQKIGTFTSMLCPISFDFYQNPLVTSEGISYEAEAIKIYYNSNSYTDPVTRQKVNPNFLIPNIILLKSVKYIMMKYPREFYQICLGNYPDLAI